MPSSPGFCLRMLRISPSSCSIAFTGGKVCAPLFIELYHSRTSGRPKSDSGVGTILKPTSESFFCALLFPKNKSRKQFFGVSLAVKVFRSVYDMRRGTNRFMVYVSSVWICVPFVSCTLFCRFLCDYPLLSFFSLPPFSPSFLEDSSAAVSVSSSRGYVYVSSHSRISRASFHVRHSINPTNVHE